MFALMAPYLPLFSDVSVPDFGDAFKLASTQAPFLVILVFLFIWQSYDNRSREKRLLEMNDKLLNAMIRHNGHGLAEALEKTS